MMTKLTPQDMFAMATLTDHYKDQLVESPYGMVSGLIRQFQAQFSEWEKLLSDYVSKDVSALSSTLNAFASNKCSKQDVINAMNNFSLKLTEFAKSWALEECLQKIEDTFGYFFKPADIIELAVAIDKSKNQCLKKAFPRSADND